jgi:alpha-methylacyl-CoA racemase
MSGPLTGLTVIELQGIGPAPFCGMVLSDMGADVIRIDRATNVPAEVPVEPPVGPLDRGRRSIAVDLKSPDGVDLVLTLIGKADALIEGFRPGVMERLGLGPDVCSARNPRLVYGRMTGWGQTGPYGQMAGHDINYISLAGCLAHIGTDPDAPPTVPLNLIGDFGGGGMLLALGVLGALVEAGRSGQGQTVDAAMVDGAAMLMASFHGVHHLGALRPRGRNQTEGASHYYGVYRCADGEYVSVGSIEPQFYSELLRLTGVEGDEWEAQRFKGGWPERRAEMATVFASKSREEWCQIMEGTDVCFAPVLTIPEAYEHPQNVERETFVEVAGVRQPAPAPRFDRTPSAVSGPPAHPGAHTDEILREAGIGEDELTRLRAEGAIK